MLRAEKPKAVETYFLHRHSFGFPSEPIITSSSVFVSSNQTILLPNYDQQSFPSPFLLFFFKPWSRRLVWRHPFQPFSLRIQMLKEYPNLKLYQTDFHYTVISLFLSSFSAYFILRFPRCPKTFHSHTSTPFFISFSRQRESFKGNNDEINRCRRIY